MFPQDGVTWALYIALAILLGALGSGLWEAVFKPVFAVIFRLVLRAGTFGVSTTVDGVYRSMARRATYLPALMLVAWVSLAMACVSGITIGVYWGEREARQDDQAQQVCKTPEAESDLAQKRLSEARGDVERAALLMVFMANLFTVLTALIFVRLKFQLNGISYFDQSLAICGPFIDDAQEKRLRSLFAGMRGRQDFINLMAEVKGIAEQHGTRLPVFAAL